MASTRHAQRRKYRSCRGESLRIHPVRLEFRCFRRNALLPCTYVRGMRWIETAVPQPVKSFRFERVAWLLFFVARKQTIRARAVAVQCSRWTEELAGIKQLYTVTAETYKLYLSRKIDYTGLLFCLSKYSSRFLSYLFHTNSCFPFRFSQMFELYREKQIFYAFSTNINRQNKKNRY